MPSALRPLLVPALCLAFGASSGLAAGLAEGRESSASVEVALASAPRIPFVTGPEALLSAARVAPLVMSGPVVGSVLGRVDEDVTVAAYGVAPQVLRIVANGRDPDELQELVEGLAERVVRVQAGELVRWKERVLTAPVTDPATEAWRAALMAPPFTRAAVVVDEVVVVSSRPALARRAVAGALAAIVAYVLVGFLRRRPLVTS